MMENNKQHSDGAVYSTSQEVSSLCSELSSSSRRLAELGANIIGNNHQSGKNAVTFKKQAKFSGL